tara:strand:- start:447 stop:1277 length:831 start_codon:yes stop_codon:yes gene_type:complete
MIFTKFIALELDRFLQNFPFKMEVEKIFLNSINESHFYHIESFDDGIESNLYDNESNLLSHVSMFKFDKLKKLKSYMNYYDVFVKIKKETLIFGEMYTMTFEGLPMNKNNQEVEEDISNLFGGTREIGNLVKSFTKNSVGVQYSINKDEFLEYMNYIRERKKEKLNLFKITISEIPLQGLIENIVFCYFLCIFKYIMPNFYNYFNDITQISDIIISFDSLVNMNKVLYESMNLIFFLNKNDELYKKLIYITMFKENEDVDLGEIDIIFSKKKLQYN